jgi:division protein CdvB (Snf7/Vps24/ESCRT-III family)
MRGLIRRFFASSKQSLKERINVAIYKLEAQKEKLEHIMAKLQRRDREIFERCVGAYLSKDYARSKMYANECSEVRSIAKLLLSMQLALERVILRLETVQEFSDLMIQLAPVLGLVREMRKQIANIVPDVASGLDEVSRLLITTVSEMKVVNGHKLEEVELNEEAKKIIEEAAFIAEQKIRESFPELPVEELEERRVPIMEAEGASTKTAPTPTGGMPSVNPPTVSFDELKIKLLEYIRNSKGALRISVCARELQASPEEVVRALKSLEEEGKIVLSR